VEKTQKTLSCGKKKIAEREGFSASFEVIPTLKYSGKCQFEHLRGLGMKGRTK
jgi:hypothetical protein